MLAAVFSLCRVRAVRLNCCARIGFLNDNNIQKSVIHWSCVRRRRRRTVQAVLPRVCVHRVLSAQGQGGGRHAVCPGQVRRVRERHVRESGLRPRAGLGQPAGPVRRVRRRQLELRTGGRHAQQLRAAPGLLEGVAHPGRVAQPGHPTARLQRVQQGRQLPGPCGQRHRRVRAQRQLCAQHVQQGHRVRRHGHRVQWVGRARRAHQLVQAAQQGRHRRSNYYNIILYAHDDRI